MGCGEISILKHFKGFCSLFSPFSSSHGAVIMATVKLQVAGPPSPLSQREKLKPSSYRSAKFFHSLRKADCAWFVWGGGVIYNLYLAVSKRVLDELKTKVRNSFKK